MNVSSYAIISKNHMKKYWKTKKLERINPEFGTCETPDFNFITNAPGR